MDTPAQRAIALEPGRRRAGPRQRVGPTVDVALEAAYRAEHCHLGLLLIDLGAELEADSRPEAGGGLHAVWQHHPRLHGVELRRRPQRPPAAAAAVAEALLARLSHRKVNHGAGELPAAQLRREVDGAELDRRAAPALPQRRHGHAQYLRGRRRSHSASGRRHGGRRVGGLGGLVRLGGGGGGAGGRGAC
eukprot:scaffold61238_cov64-Phaeocystis_antarctica.AAC.12